MRGSVLALFLILTPVAAQAQTYCPDIKDFVPSINVFLTAPDPDFDFSKSKKELTKNTEAVTRKWAKTEEQRVWIEKGFTAGLARAGTGFRWRARNIGKRYGGYGSHYFCLFFNNIEIEVFYGATLFVVKDFKDDSCDFKITLAHEFQHHDINMAIANKYVERLKKDLPVMLQQVENYGYVPHHQMDARFQLMRDSLADAVDIYMEEMHKEMTAENAKIDTLENYQRESLICVEARRQGR